MNLVRFEQAYNAFEATIVSPDLKRVAKHWRNICSPIQLPRWSDIRPSEIKSQLPNVWCYEYDIEQNDFVGRLAGQAITRVSDQPFKGTKLSELRPADRHPRSLIRARRVIQEPALYRGEGLVDKTAEHYGIGERVMMPLGKDSTSKAGVFGATVYSLLPMDSPRLPRERKETEHWFSLAEIFPSPVARLSW